MTDLPTIALVLFAGFQSGCIASWRYYRRQRDDQDAVRHQYDERIRLLEHDLDRERLERRQAEETLRSINNPRRQTDRR